VTDTRFTTVFDGIDDLLDGVDIDEIGDLETLLMFLFARPMGVSEALDDDDETVGLEIRAHSEHAHQVGLTVEFPTSVIDLVRICAEALAGVGPYRPDGDAEREAPNVRELSDASLITELQQTLGKVRVFNLMDDDG
jgi:hypothetical protein